LKKLRDLRISTVVWLTPILSFINDTEDNISGILDMCMKAKVYGVICFGRRGSFGGISGQSTLRRA